MNASTPVLPRPPSQSPPPFGSTPATPKLQSGYVLMVASLLFFVANNLLIRGISVLPGYDAWLATACRFILGLAVVCALYMAAGRLELGAIIQRPVMVLRGVMGGLAIYIFYITLPALGVGRATLINSGYVLFAAVLAGPFLGERLTLAKIGWFITGCAGIAILCGGASLTRTVGIMDAVALLGAVLAAGSVIAVRELSVNHHFSTIFASQCFYGLVMAAVPAGASSAQPGALMWGAIMLAACLAAAGQLTMTRAYKELPVAQGGAIHMLSPLICAIGGALLYQERYSPLEVLGGAITLYSCWRVLAVRKERTAGAHRG